MTLGEHQEHFSRDVVKLMTKALELGYEIRMGECQRSEEQQRLYIKQGKSTTMNSMHIKKCAIGLHFTKNGELMYPSELGDYWESLDPINKWGGHWKSFVDKPHFQRTV